MRALLQSRFVLRFFSVTFPAVSADAGEMPPPPLHVSPAFAASFPAVRNDRAVNRGEA
jgi:hypothetical protein